MRAHFGTTRQHADVGGFRVSEVWFPACVELPLHRHDRPQFTMVAKGSLLETGEIVGRNAGPSGAAFRPAGYLHDTHFGDSEAIGLVVEASDERWRGIASLFNFPTAQYAEVRNLASIFDRIHNELAGNTAAGRLVLETAMLDFTLAVSRSMRRVPLVDDVIAAIDGDPSRRWDLPSLAVIVGATTDDVDAAIETPLSSFVLSRRVEIARRLLVGTNDPIAEIAEMAGFYDQAHLTRALVRATGSTPRKLRARQRGR